MVTKTRISYVVCATPRSGSSLLCEGLETTGAAGHPQEYFGEPFQPTWAERWRARGFDDYLRGALNEGTSPNGVFGAKVMWGDFPQLMHGLRNVTGRHDLTGRDLLSTVFPNLHYIWAVRRDTVRQAVSYSKALQTDVWNVTDDRWPASQGAAVSFDFDAVERLVAQIRADNEAWRRYFAAAGIDPFTVVYEDLVEDIDGTIAQIFDYLRITPIREEQRAPLRLRKQADAQSDDWVAQYVKRSSPPPP